MAVKGLALGSVGDLDAGKVSIAFNRHLRKAIGDCEDRPGDTTARKVTVELEIKPVMEDGSVDVIVLAKIKGKIPDHVSSGTRCQLRTLDNATGKVAAFNDMSEDNPRQRTVDDLTEE